LSKRYEELDSLRGIASLTVVFNHCLITLTFFYTAITYGQINSTFLKIFSFSPVHFVWAGHEAVILFFILSGFVLSLPFLNHQAPKYSTFIVKRFFRIYTPYIFTMLLSMTLFLLFKNIIDDNFKNISISSWFIEMWSHPISFNSFLSYIFMFGLDTHNINTATWSLIYEMRISLFFPLIMVLILKYDWKKSLIFGLSSSMMLFIFFIFISKLISNSTISSLIESLSETFYYSSFFIVGAVFAKYKQKISNWFISLNLVKKTFLGLVSAILYTAAWNFPVLGSLQYDDSTRIPQTLISLTIDSSIALSVLIFFMFALSSNMFQTILKNKIFLHLGKISYSLYLIHTVVLLCSIYLLKNILPIIYILIFVPFISIFVASLMYKFIEKPSISLGKRLPNTAIIFEKKKSIS
jgi:peptidoglycan/LPS O-acetylase OafA/YrhL